MLDSCQLQTNAAALTTLSVFDAHSVHNIEDFDMTVATVEHFGWYVHTLQDTTYKLKINVDLV